MIRIVAAFALVLVLVSAGAVYNLKQATERLEERKRELSRNILEDQEAIKVLKAEMAYLGRPERLQRLADRFLNLGPAGNLQLASSLEGVSRRDDEAVRLAGYPVDNFPLLLPREKPQKAGERPASPAVRAARRQELQVRGGRAVQKVAERVPEKPAEKSFYDRILTKLEKHN